MVAPCRANGAQMRVVVPSLALEKSRSRTAASSRATRVCVLHPGSSAFIAASGPTARPTNSRASAEANSLAELGSQSRPEKSHTGQFSMGRVHG